MPRRLEMLVSLGQHAKRRREVACLGDSRRTSVAARRMIPEQLPPFALDRGVACSLSSMDWSTKWHVMRSTSPSWTRLPAPTTGVQLLDQHRSSAMKPRPHGTHRAPQGRRRIGIALVVKVAQDDDFTVVRRQ